MILGRQSTAFFLIWTENYILVLNVTVCFFLFLTFWSSEVILFVFISISCMVEVKLQEMDVLLAFNRSFRDAQIVI